MEGQVERGEKVVEEGSQEMEVDERRQAETATPLEGGATAAEAGAEVPRTWTQVDGDIAFRLPTAERSVPEEHPNPGKPIPTVVTSGNQWGGVAVGDTVRVAPPGLLAPRSSSLSDWLTPDDKPRMSPHSTWPSPWGAPVSAVASDWKSRGIPPTWGPGVASSRMAAGEGHGVGGTREIDGSLTRDKWGSRSPKGKEPVGARRGTQDAVMTSGRGGGDAPAVSSFGGRPSTRPRTFDGTSSLKEYLSHFDLCVVINGWSGAQAGAFLGVSLMGTARRLLEGINSCTEEGYTELRRRLVARFEPENATGTHKAKLRAMERTEAQTLSEFADEVVDLVRKSYPGMAWETQDTLAMDRFVDALPDPDLRLWILQAKPATLNAAVASGIEGETCLAREKSRRPRVRSAQELALAQGPGAGPPPPPPAPGPAEQISEMVKLVTATNQQLMNQQNNQQSYQRPAQRSWQGRGGGGGARKGNCNRCQQPGHHAWECQAPAPVPRSAPNSSASSAPPASEN